MMFRLTTYRFLLFCLMLSCVQVECLIAEEQGGVEKKFQEPPLRYSVQIGDRTISATEGSLTPVEGTFTNPQIKITPEPYRVFNAEGISFKYPENFDYEGGYIDNKTTMNWILTGNGLKISYYVFKDTLTTADFAEAFIKNFGRKYATIVDPDAKVTVGKKTLSGTSVLIELAGQKLVMDFYLVPSNPRITKILATQTKLDDAGNKSAEYKSVFSMLSSSFQFEE